jgi:hypothetical protein
MSLVLKVAYLEIFTNITPCRIHMRGQLHTITHHPCNLIWHFHNQRSVTCKPHLHMFSVSLCRQECKCTPVHYFVVLSMQRSGSGWFETLLNNHPNISSYGEVFSNAPERRKNFPTIAGFMDKVYNLDWQNSAAKNECTAAVGFKWMLNQVGRLHWYPAYTRISPLSLLSSLVLPNGHRTLVSEGLIFILFDCRDRWNTTGRLVPILNKWGSLSFCCFGGTC